MPRHILVFIVCLITTSLRSGGQQQATGPSMAGKERVAFENTLDSLFMERSYKQIIDLCQQPHPAYLSAACTYNLIGAYYFFHDSAASWTLLNKEIARIRSYADADAYSLDNLLEKDYAVYRKFLMTSTAKDYILGKIDSLYEMEPVSDKENGRALLHLLIEDQWVRNTSSLYDHFKPERRHLLPSHMDSTQAIRAQQDHCTKVFSFFKARHKVYSKAEVGRIYYWQLMLFFHEWALL